jgi:hypothetical protein
MTVSDDRPPRRSAAPGEPAQSRRGGRRFSDREVALILKRATELQTSDTGETEVGAGGMSLDDLQDIAREAGIDPRLVARAAGEVDAPPDRREASPLAGAPLELSLERTVEGEVPEDEFEVLLEQIRRTFGEPGQVATVGRSLTWSSSWQMMGYGRRAVGRMAYVSISVRHGVTTVRIEEQMKGLARQLFGGIMGGLGGGSGGIFMGIGAGIFQSIGAAFGLWGMGIGASYLLARHLFGRSVRRREREMHELMNRLVDHVSETVVLAPRLPRSAARPALAAPDEAMGDGDPNDA